ncbi:MAG: lanthionine synthetase LanC family protein [Steroidobacteraceae bacterium]
MPHVRLPRPQEATLENGLRVLVLRPASRIPTFTARLVLSDAGGLYEPADRRGLARSTVDLLAEGTASRSARELARQLETLGATLKTDAPPSSAEATITLTGLATYFDPSIELLADIVRRPAFAEKEVAQYASRTAADLELTRARPEFLSQEAVLKAIYGDHPAALAAPSAAAIKATTPQELRQFHAARYRSGGALLVIVGDTELDSVLPAVRRVFGDWGRTQAPANGLPAVAPTHSRAVRLIDRPGSVQTVLQLGTVGITRTAADYFPLLVMNQVLGGSASSRLYQNLRERNGYTYGAYSGFTAALFPGVWQITTSVRTEVTAGAMKELLAEMERIRQEPVTPVELESAKRTVIGKFIFSLERPDNLLDSVITQAIYGLPADYWERYVANVQAVSIEDVQHVANKIIDLEHLQIAAVADASKVRPVLAQYGPLTEGSGPRETAAAAAPAQLDRARMRRTIEQIADELIARADKQPHGIGWTNATAPQETFNFYDGTPGVAYFLLKAYQATGNHGYRHAAEQSIEYLLSEARSDAQGMFFDARLNGVFQGNAGAGYLLLYAHHVTGEQRYLDAAQKIAHRIVLVPDVAVTSSPDIIAGAAGTGLFLLAMNQWTKDPLYLRGARILGDFLVRQAEPRGAGVTWKLADEGKEYYFVGFSHGPAGVGYFLDKLRRATGDSRYGATADRAMTHIEAIAVKEGSGNDSMVKWYHEQLKRADLYSSQWCHGAPGMNPFFLQLYSRNGERRFLDWATVNTRYLVQRGVDVRKNPGVCHGIAGNAASLYLMYRATGDGAYLSEVEHAVDLVYGYLDRQSDEKQLDPGYMTGVAGVGDFLVLLYSEGKLNMFGPLGYGEDVESRPRAPPGPGKR